MGRNFSSLAGEMSLAATISDTATSAVLSTVASLPDPPFTLVFDAGAAGEEVTTVTDIAGTTVTIERGVDSTVAVQHTVGARVLHMATAQDFQVAADHIDATDGVHGLAPGEVLVGTSTNQVLTNKAISGADNDLSDIPDSAIVAVSATKITGSRTATSGASASFSPATTRPVSAK